MSDSLDVPNFRSPNIDIETIESSRSKIITDYCKRLISRSALILGLVTSSVAVEMADPSPPAAEANGGYPDWNLPCVAEGDQQYGQTQGTGYWCNGYQWGHLSSGQQNSSRGYGYRNCTDYVAWRVASVSGLDIRGLGNATTWDNRATGRGLTVRPAGQPPQVGDVAQWEGDDGNPYSNPGHVAYVEETFSDGSVRVAEYNQKRDGNFTKTRVTRADRYIDVPGDIASPPTNQLSTRNTVNFTNGDNKEDIAWYELYPGHPGTLAAINSSGSNHYIGWKEVGIGPAGWKGTGDFNGDGKTDIAWHEGSTLTIFTSSGQSFGIAWRLPGIGSPTWAGVGDLNNDGKDDIAWYEQNSSSLSAFITNSAGNWMDIPYRANGIGAPDWAGVGDFNGDGKDDVAWHEGSTLTNIASTGQSWGILWRNPGIGRPTWAQVGEFSGDNKDDIAWYEAGSSTVTTLASSGSTFDIRGRMFNIGAPTWAYVGDFTGDKKDDIAWYEQGSSTLASFVSNGSHFNIGWKALGIGRPNWAGVGDFNGDSKDDLAWHEGSTLTNIASTGGSWGIIWRVPGIGKPAWASRGAFPQ